MRLVEPDDLAILPTLTPTPDACPAPSPDDIPKRLSDEQSKLVEDHYHLVAQVLRTFLRKRGQYVRDDLAGIDEADLESAGVAGLMRAGWKFDPASDGSFGAYARVAIRNAMQDAADTLASQRRMDRAAALPGIVDGKGRMDVQEYAPAPSEAMEDDEIEAVAAAFLDTLPTKLRAVADLRRGGLTLKQTAERLGVSKGAVQGRIEKIRERIKSTLGDW